MTIMAVDTSNFQGPLTARFAECLKDNGWDHVVVRLSLEDAGKHAIAWQQLRTCIDAGLGVSGYIWAYMDQNPEELAQAAIDGYGSLPLKRWWVDVEDTGHAGTVAQNMDWLARCLYYLQARGKPPGIYTGAWFWPSHLGHADFSDYPLWAAQYDGIPDLDVWQSFSFWGSIAGKQYTATGNVCGMHPLDLNVFDEAVFEEAPLSQAERDELDYLRAWHGLTMGDYATLIHDEVRLAKAAKKPATVTAHLDQIQNVADTLERG